MTNYASRIGYNESHGPEVRLFDVTYTVYIDVLFLINFVMDILVLMVLNQFLHRSTAWWKLGLGGLFGAAWGCILLFVNLQGTVWRIVMLAVTGMGMVGIAFEWGASRKGRMKRIAQETGALFGTAAVMGGVFEGLAEQEILSLGAWIFLAAATFFLSRFLGDLLCGVIRKRKHLCQVIATYQGKSVEVTALQDTGNRLVSPDGRQPVHVLEYEVCRHICETVDGVLYIPFQSVGKENGMLPAIYLDSLVIIREGERTEIKKPLVGVVKQPLSPDGTYHMLLNEKT